MPLIIFLVTEILICKKNQTCRDLRVIMRVQGTNQVQPSWLMHLCLDSSQQYKDKEQLVYFVAFLPLRDVIFAATTWQMFTIVINRYK